MGCGALFSGCGGSSSGVKRLVRDIDHSTVSSAKVKNEWRYTTAPLICVHEVDWDKFTFLPYYNSTQFGVFVLQELKSRVKLNSASVVDVVFFLNNQPDALIIQILFCYKTLHFSGIFSAHHQEFSIVHSALISFMQVSDDRFQAESGWNCSSILTLLGSGHQKPSISCNFVFIVKGVRVNRGN
jgi:hypothetical protein